MLLSDHSPLFIFGMMCAAIGTSSLSTGLIQWCVNPYVTSIKLLDEPSRQLQVETLSFWGNPVYTRIHASNLAQSKRAFTNWQIKPTTQRTTLQESTDDQTFSQYLANGRKWPMKPRSLFYIHPSLMQQEDQNALMKEIYADVTGSVNAAASKQSWDDMISKLEK
jgi:hypothetical protein